MRKLETPPLDVRLEGDNLFMDGREPHGQVRLLAEMESVAADRSFPKDLDKGAPAYFMYDDLYPASKEALIRYDITLLPSGFLGTEYRKTMGHYHAMATPGQTYPELYQILSGEAHFVLQHRVGSGAVDRVLVVETITGDTLLVPPNWGHVAINPGPEPMVFCDLVSLRCESDYTEYLEKRGGACWEMEGSGLEWNPAYGNPIPIQRCRVSDASIFDLLYQDGVKRPDIEAILRGKDHILAQFVANPLLFEFLSDPEAL